MVLDCWMERRGDSDRRPFIFAHGSSSRNQAKPINMQIGNTHPRNSDRFFFLRRIIELHVGI